MFEKLQLEEIDYSYLLMKLDKDNLNYTINIFKEVTNFTDDKEENRELLVEFKNFYEKKLEDEKISENDKKISENDKKILRKIFKTQYRNLERVVILSNKKEIAAYVLKNITDILTLKNLPKF